MPCCPTCCCAATSSSRYRGPTNRATNLKIVKQTPNYSNPLFCCPHASSPFAVKRATKVHAQSFRKRERRRKQTKVKTGSLAWLRGSGPCPCPFRHPSDVSKLCRLLASPLRSGRRFTRLPASFFFPNPGPLGGTPLQTRSDLVRLPSGSAGQRRKRPTHFPVPGVQSHLVQAAQCKHRHEGG